MGLFCFSFHCIVNDIGHIAGAISAVTSIAATLTAAFPPLSAGFELASLGTGGVALAADATQCATERCDPAQLVLDAMALVPGLAATKYARTVDRLEEEIKAGKVTSKALRQLENTKAFNQLVQKVLDLNAAGLATGAFVASLAPEADASSSSCG